MPKNAQKQENVTGIKKAGKIFFFALKMKEIIGILCMCTY